MGDLVAQLDIDPARKAKVDAEAWLSELNELTSSDKHDREKIDSQINELPFEDIGDLISKTSTDSFISSSENNSPLYAVNMNIKSTQSEIFRVSISSSAPSTSSHGSTHDEFDSFGEIYIWGENNNFSNYKGITEILTPKPLETNLLIDVQNVSCGAHHAAILTKNGEIFTWGEEYKGRLGHAGSLTESTRPRLVESLTGSNLLESISCGEFHTCAVTVSGELYTWGDGSNGILGHGTNTSHWIPKRVSGTIDGLTVCTVSCGTWHTALITSTGQLYTFGDGTFGVLGHGNRENVFYPKEVDSLTGLRTVSVSCGTWHTAGVVQVTASPTGEIGTGMFGKLFTWGDGDKYRLGHGDKEPRLKPTCVPSLIENNFISVSCGHSITLGLSISGEVFTMGSNVYGQLGNPNSDGRYPVSVTGPLVNESVREISSGSYHVAVLTNKGEVFTWGKGSNGRLGHGDTDERKVPTLVDGLKDKTVKSIGCGSGFTIAVCLSKRVPVSDQAQCSMCRQSFGFTRKKHTCYHCGLVCCNNCSAQKSFRASLGPNPSKPYRVCDSCYIKLNNNNNNINNNKKRNNNLNNNNNSVEPSRNLESSSSFPLVQIVDMQRGNVNNKKVVNGSFGFRANGSRPVSPFSRRSSPPRSVTPGPAMRGLSLSKGYSSDGLKKSNELLNEQVQRLRTQVNSLKLRCESQEIELKKLAKEANDANELASEESSKSKAAKEVIKTLTSQLKEMADKIPVQNNTNGGLNQMDNTCKEEDTNDININKKVVTGIIGDNGSRVQSLLTSSNQGDKEWIEQYEPGVYITLITFHDGTRDLKRVRFSRRRFGENQAELWWNENREKVYEKYNVRAGSDRVSSASSVRSSSRA